MAGAYVLVMGGVVVTGTARSIKFESGDFDLDYAVTTLAVDRTLLGREQAEIRIISADPLFKMNVGDSYLIYANPAKDMANLFTPVETYLFDNSGDEWVARASSGVDPVDTLIVNEGEVEGLIQESRQFLAGRQEAGKADLRLRSGGADGEVIVSGYASGAAIALQVCDASDPEFRPMRGMLSCDSGTIEMITPSGGSFTISYEEPSRLDLPGGVFSCTNARCSLVAYDVGWPDEVFATFAR